MVCVSKNQCFVYKTVEAAEVDYNLNVKVAGVEAENITKLKTETTVKKLK